MKTIVNKITGLAAALTAVIFLASCEKEYVKETVDTVPVITSFVPKAAPVGAEVVVTGESLHNVTTAYVGDVQVEILQKVSKNRLSIKIIDGVSVGKISLVNKNGKGTSEENFTCTFAVPEITSSLLQTEADMGDEILITGKNLNSASAVVFTAAGYTEGHEAAIIFQNDREIIVKVPYVEAADARITMKYFDGNGIVSTDEASAPAIKVIRYVPVLDPYTLERTAVGKSITLTGQYLNNIDKVYVGEFEASCIKTPGSLTFTIPGGDFEDGETTVILRATYFDENETFVLDDDFTVYVPFVKYWENIVSECQTQAADGMYASFFSPENGKVYENAKWATDLDPVAMRLQGTQWGAANTPKEGMITDEEYDSVLPYFFFSSVSTNYLQLNSPANSNGQLKNFGTVYPVTSQTRVPGTNTSPAVGTPILTFRYLNPSNATEKALIDKVKGGQLENINEELFPIDVANSTIGGISFTSAAGGLRHDKWCDYAKTAAEGNTLGYKPDAVFLVAYYDNYGYNAESRAANIRRLGILHVTNIDWKVSNNTYQGSQVTYNCYWQKYDYDYSKL